MQLQNLGYDIKTKVHHPALTAYESTFLGLLWVDHVGHENRISANVLATMFHFTMHGIEIDKEKIVEVAKDISASSPSRMDRWKRDVRELHNHLLFRHPNIPLLSRAGLDGGYWMAENESEANAFFHTFRKRGMTGLYKASRGKKAILADIVRQLTFEFDDLNGEATEHRGELDKSAPIEVVDALLEKMTRNPERFAGELRRLGEKFGSVLLPRTQVREMLDKAAELQKLVSAIGGA